MHYIRISTLVLGILFSTSLVADAITWTAQTPQNALSDPANWTPQTVPGINDTAIFDSTIPNVNKFR